MWLQRPLYRKWRTQIMILEESSHWCRTDHFSSILVDLGNGSWYSATTCIQFPIEIYFQPRSAISVVDVTSCDRELGPWHWTLTWVVSRWTTLPDVESHLVQESLRTYTHRHTMTHTDRSTWTTIQWSIIISGWSLIVEMHVLSLTSWWYEDRIFMWPGHGGGL